MKKGKVQNITTIIEQKRIITKSIWKNILNRYLMTKNIDEHLNELVETILLYKTELDILISWHNNEWLKLIDEKTNEFKEKYEETTNKWRIWDGWIYKYIVEPKEYQYYVYVRSFLEKLYVYLNKEHPDNKKHKEMWESSKYLKYYVHLIFKTGFYDNNKYKKNKKIINELKRIMSFLSEPLHGFPIYFNKKYISSNETKSPDKVSEIMQKKVNKIVNLILNRNINDNAINHPIYSNVDHSKKEYLKWTTHLQEDNCEMKPFLKFFKNNCLIEFEDEIKKRQKFEENMKNLKQKYYSKI